jgi:hypothetical protein
MTPPTGVVEDIRWRHSLKIKIRRGGIEWEEGSPR